MSQFSPMATHQQPDDADIVIFGATGDLSKRKLLPALAHMHRWGLLAPGSRIIGVVRDTTQVEAWRDQVHAALHRYAPDVVADKKAWDGFADMLLPIQGDLEDPAAFRRLRDMIQSHLLQLLTLVAMEPPVEMTATAVRNEKIKVLRAMRRFRCEDVAAHALRAQYSPGIIDGESVAAYRAEPGVAPDSATETFAALRMYVDNWRWQGVPFLLRTGKRLPQRVSEIAIRFRKPPLNLFADNGQPLHGNKLVCHLQPNEGMSLDLIAKQPGLERLAAGCEGGWRQL